MQISVKDLPRFTGNNVVAIGMFDGVHLGHQAVFKAALAQREATGSKVFALTFEPHPISILKPGIDVPCLSAPLLKEELILEFGIDAVLFLEFDAELQCVPAEGFIENILIKHLSVKHVVVGEDFRFGCEARGDIGLLGTYIGSGLTSVIGVEIVKDANGPIRSTRVREEIGRGDLRKAKELMGRNLRITGKVEHGFGRGGHKVGFPTANIQTPEIASIPANGVYAGLIWYRGKKYQAAVNVGTSPTFKDVNPKREVQAHLIDAEIDLYGEEVELEFIDRIRDEIQFSDIEKLRQQIPKDILRVRHVLEREK